MSYRSLAFAALIVGAAACASGGGSADPAEGTTMRSDTASGRTMSDTTMQTDTTVTPSPAPMPTDTTTTPTMPTTPTDSMPTTPPDTARPPA